MIKVRDDKHLEEILKASGRGKHTSDPNVRFEDVDSVLVEFYVDWADTCQDTKPIWAELSVKYSTKKMRFAEVNIGLKENEELAKKYRINTGVMSKQLPTLALFENGEEYLRFPPIDEQTGRSAKVVKYDKTALVKYFDLDKRFAATRDLNQGHSFSKY
eukprot:TRINITY_DN5002_c0_g2_i1.p1 TRINITY_DN5002_c0_g2~~TRINITY_DN5002_c0_g2_i1.p1  ORF type:complete len:159 (-),score=30.71 TRINITY_DN5002_c0_g2_i1:446-922(-)